MKKIFLSLILGTLILAAATAQAEVVDKIEILVNDEIITQSEIDRILAPVYEQYKTAYQGNELIKKLVEARQKIIQQLVEDRLVLSEAKKLNVEVDEKEIEARISEMTSRFESKKKLERALLEQHLTLKEIRTRYKEQLMRNRLIEQKIGSRITITPIEINNYYAKHVAEFTQLESLKIRNILIKPKLDSQKALNLARDVLKKIQGGGDFVELAKIYSEGPNAKEGALMTDVKKGDLMPEIEKAVFDLKEGEVSGIIQTSLGYHIFKIEERSEERTLSLPEVRRNIEEILFRERIRDKMKDWIENLKKNAYIEFK